MTVQKGVIPNTPVMLHNTGKIDIQGEITSKMDDTLHHSVNIAQPWILTQPGIELTGILLGEASELWVRTPAGKKILLKGRENVVLQPVRQNAWPKKNWIEPCPPFCKEMIYLFSQSKDINLFIEPNNGVNPLTTPVNSYFFCKIFQIKFSDLR